MSLLTLYLVSNGNKLYFPSLCVFLVVVFFKKRGGRGKGKITCIPTIYSLKGEGVTSMCEIYILSP